MKLQRFPKYTQNLGYTKQPAWNLPSNRGPEEARVYSYNTCVAIQRGPFLEELGYWSATTRKHVNYAAEQLSLRVKHFEA